MRPVGCDQPRGYISGSLESLGMCLIHAGQCAEGGRRLLLAEEIRFRDQVGAVNLSYRVGHRAERLTRDYPDCAAALGELQTNVQTTQELIDELQKLVRTGQESDRSAELDRALAAHGLRCIRSPKERSCRLIPLLSKGS